MGSIIIFAISRCLILPIKFSNQVYRKWNLKCKLLFFRSARTSRARWTSAGSASDPGSPTALPGEMVLPASTLGSVC